MEPPKCASDPAFSLVDDRVPVPSTLRSTARAPSVPTMQVAGGVDLGEALAHLAATRPIFHSEADFQLALAWELQLRDPMMRVRLETRPEPGTHLDIACDRPDLGSSTALELKYLTRLWSGLNNGEQFELKNHGAQDIRGYDVVKDISRVERFVQGHPGRNGGVLVVSNDPYYWRGKPINDVTNAAAFRIGEGVVLHGNHAWGPNTGAGTKKHREAPLFLSGTYTLKWSDYSSVSAPPSGSTHFRSLLVEVP